MNKYDKTVCAIAVGVFLFVLFIFVVVGIFGYRTP